MLVRVKFRRFAIWGIIVLGTALIVVACAGPTGEQGPPGEQGAPGQQGPPGPAGLPGKSPEVPLPPGIASEITGVTIDDSGVPSVSFTLASSDGTPLRLDDVESTRFLIARIVVDEETGLTSYANYLTQDVEGTEYNYKGEVLEPALNTTSQPRFEAGEGEFADLGNGEYSYTFGESLPDDYDPEATHVVGLEVVRGPRSVAANAVFTFVPAGGDPSITRVISETESCNNCHGELGLHGGSRKEFEMCVLCHTPQNVDPESGSSLDMKVMVHKIHSGERLPTVQEGGNYYIVGFRGSIHDYSTVAWPQDTRNCATCHTGPDADNLKTAPSSASCLSCHDNVDPGTSLNHPGRPKTDVQCVDCHLSDDIEFDLGSITGAHTIPRMFTRLDGVNFEIAAVDDAAPGKSPVVTFKITTDEGDPIAPAEMDYLAVTLAGPASDYTERITETIYRAAEDAPAPAVVDAGDGAFSYTFQYVIPDEAAGTYALAMEGYRMEETAKYDEPIRDAGYNPVIYVALDGGEPDPRREVIDRAQCNNCHGDLALHGTIRQNTDYCVMCHNVNATDEARRPEEEMPPETINFRVLIHRIHRGEEAANPAQIYGFGGNLHDFGEVAFPGDLVACETCHLPDTYNLTALSGLEATSITQAGTVIDVIPPIQATCNSCHDSNAAAGHAELQTTDANVETCEVCHAPGREFDASEAHK